MALITAVGTTIFLIRKLSFVDNVKSFSSKYRALDAITTSIAQIS